MAVAHFKSMQLASFLLTSSITLCLVSVPALSQDGGPPTDDEKKMAQSLGAFGLALGGLVTKVAQDSQVIPKVSDQDAQDSQQALNQLVEAHKLTRDGGLGAVNLLDASFDVALTGVDVTTGGSSLLATTGVRWVKRVALDGLAAKIDEDAKASLAGGIDKLIKDDGLDYETLRGESPDEIKMALDKVDEFKSMEDKLAGDPGGQSVLEKAAIDLIVATDKGTLDQLAETQQDVATTQGQLTDLAHSVSQYMNDTTNSLQELNGGVATANQSISEAQDAIASLSKQTDANSQDLGRIQSFMFGQASAQQRKLMLDSGFMGDLKESNPTAFDALQQETDAAAQREQLVGEMNHVVQQFDDVGKIAQNLGIDIPGLPEVLTVANTADTVVSDIAGGDYLGAIVGITGLFGHHTDPLEAFQKQLFGYLDGQFKVVDGKLDQVIAGQQQIMTGLATLSKQMATYDEGVQDHLDRLEFKIDNVEETTLQNLYWPLTSCYTLKKDIINELNAQGAPRLDLTSFDQARIAASRGSAADCINYLRDLYGVAFSPTKFGFDPLALRYYVNAPPTDVYVVKTDSNAVSKYVTGVQDFLIHQYKPTLDFLKAARSVPNPFGGGGNVPNGMKLTNVLGAAALPARGVKDYQTKITWFSKDAKACARGTVLGEPLVNVLCWDPSDDDSPTLTLRTLTVSGSQALEDNAQQVAARIMEDPLMRDQLVDLAKLAEFFAPLYDYSDPATGTVFADFDKFLSQPAPGGKGENLIRGALQTLTFGVAEGDMLYGDVTAGLIFHTLWAGPAGFTTTDQHVVIDATGTPSLVSGDSDLQNQAIALLQTGNPYLQSNVLMLALDSASLVSGDGQEFAYEQALDLLKNADVEPESQLNVLFQGELHFKNLWRPLKVADDQASADAAAKDCESSHDMTKCIKVPAATFLGVDVPLPSPDDFTRRTFVYPSFLLEMLGTRDRMAALLADYEVFNAAVAADSDPAKAAARIAKTVILAYQ